MEKIRLKISFLLPNRGGGGGVRAIVRFGNELMKRGHDVRIFYREDIFGLRGRAQRLYYQIRFGHGNDWLLDFKGSSFQYSELNSHEFAPDELIVSMCARTTLDAWHLPKDVGIKVLHCHGPEIENWEMMLEAWKHPMQKIVVSSYLIDMLKKEVNHMAIGVAPDGVDTNEYFPCLSEKERTTIGSAFSWRWSKDPVSTIRIMEMLGEKLPGVPLCSFGAGRRPRGFSNVAYKRQPTVSQGKAIYSSCRVWFLASIDEGFGLPILEAMACGCAVVSTDCGGPRDIIEDGVNGFLVDVGNVGAMTHKIITLYQDDNLRKHICQNAMKTAREFSWSKGAVKLEEYLISIYDSEVHKGRLTLVDQKRDNGCL